MKYYNKNTEDTIKYRLRRCIKKAKKGQWKKADAALGDGAIINLHINNNWQKTQSKFVPAQPITSPTASKPQQWHLKDNQIHNILKNIPPQSTGGNSAINNDIILWAINNNNVSNIEGSLSKLAKSMTRNTMTGVLRKLILYTKGLPLGKPDKNKPDPQIDDDVRPVVICDSVLRIIDKLAYDNVPITARMDAMGPYQVVGRPNAAEIATEGVNRALIMLGLMDNVSLISLDAQCIRTVNRYKLYEFTWEKLPDHYLFSIFVRWSH